MPGQPHTAPAARAGLTKANTSLVFHNSTPMAEKRPIELEEGWSSMQVGWLFQLA